MIVTYGQWPGIDGAAQDQTDDGWAFLADAI